MRLSPNNDLFIINRRVRITTLMFAHKNKTNDFINEIVIRNGRPQRAYYDILIVPFCAMASIGIIV